MKNSILVFVLLFTATLFAQEFDAYFEDKTLRLDYVFGGNAEEQYVFLDELASYPKWYGRRHHLDTHLLRGEGQVQVVDKESGQVIFVNSFSTLFQEWLAVPEAKYSTRSYENVFLVPFPKRDAEVRMVWFDNEGKEVVKATHDISPKDILIHAKGQKNIVTHEVIHPAVAKEKVINVAIVAEGYTVESMGEFMAAARTAVEAILNHEPFGKYSDVFNFVAVQSVSAENGVSQPALGKWKSTAVESNFDTFYSSRYLTTARVKKLHDILAGVPYDHIIVLANTATYGGGGIYNGYTLTAVDHPNFKPVVVHEFGHSFAALADEYFYPNDVLSELIEENTEPWERNITTLKNFESKWIDLLDANIPIPTPNSQKDTYPIGVYEGLEGNGIYKAGHVCRMLNNSDVSFCIVCQKAIEELILFYTE